MRITITGGTGFLGGHLARALAVRGHFPTVVARGVNSHTEEIRKIANVSYVPAMIGDERKLFHALNNCDAVANVVGINKETERGEYQKVHVENTVRVIHAMRKAGVKRIIHVSYLKARPKTHNRYLQSKWEAEELIRNSGLDYTILQPAMIFGPGDHMVSHISRALDTLPIFSPPFALGVAKIRPVAIEDMVELMIAGFIERRMIGQTIAVLGPETMTLTEAVKRVAKVKGKSAVVLPLPAAIHYTMAAVLERLTSDPLFSMAQVKMLCDDMSTPLKGSDLPADDLQPKTHLTEETIRAALDT